MSLLVLASVIFSISTALIALYAEVSSHTPYSSKHSLIRGFICVSCIIFAGFAIGPAYIPNVLHLLATAFIFIVSCMQFYLEASGKTVTDFLIELDEELDRGKLQ